MPAFFYEPADDYDYPAEPATPEEVDSFYRDWPPAPPPSDSELDEMAAFFQSEPTAPF